MLQKLQLLLIYGSPSLPVKFNHSMKLSLSLSLSLSLPPTLPHSPPIRHTLLCSHFFLRSNELHGSCVLHSLFHECHSNQYRSPAEASHTVHSHTPTRVITKRLLHHIKPLSNDLRRRGSTIFKETVLWGK